LNNILLVALDPKIYQTTWGVHTIMKRQSTFGLFWFTFTSFPTLSATLGILRLRLRLPLRKMGVSLPAIFILLVTILTFGWRVLNWLWVTPKYLERRLREQGLAGNSYRILSEDLKDSSLMSKQAISKPITFSDDISPRVVPFFHHIVKTYGTSTNFWDNFYFLFSCYIYIYI
jgi:hypothetical protein